MRTLFRRSPLRWAVALFILATTTAQARELKDLVDAPSRPTMHEIGEWLPLLEFSSAIPVVQGVDPRNNHITNYHFPVWLKSILTHGPKLIAAMEKTFPGATWAFVGRDTQALGDLVEAFYLSIGQPERVVRLGVSKGSFQDYEESTMLEFLEDHGFSLKNVRNNHPYIFVDTVSGGYGRQARLMLDLIYRRARDAGEPVHHLVRKVNIFGLVVSTFAGTQNPFQNAEHYLAEEEQLIESGLIRHYGNEHRIITFDNPGDTFNEAGYAHYTSSWHGPFGALRRRWGDHIEADPGPPLPKDMRESILWLQKELWQGIHRPDFLAAVQLQARALGYEFPLTRPEPKKVEIKVPEIPEEVRELIAQAEEQEYLLKKRRAPAANSLPLFDLIAELPKKIESPEDGLSTNGEKVAEWMRRNRVRFNPLDWSLLMIRAARAGRSGLRFRGNDLRMVAREAFLAPPTISLLQETFAFASEAKAFRDMLKSATWMVGEPGYENFKSVRTVWRQSLDCPKLLELAAREREEEKP